MSSRGQKHHHVQSKDKHIQRTAHARQWDGILRNHWQEHAIIGFHIQDGFLAKPVTRFIGWDKPLSEVTLYEVLKNAAIDKHGQRGAVL